MACKRVLEAETESVIDVLHAGDVLNYTIPSCSVITVKVQHAVISVWDGDKSETVQFDVFFKHCPEQPLRVPCSVEVLDSCYVPVSQKYIYYVSKK